MTDQTKRVVLKAGPVEFYEAGSGPPLLLLHGALTNAHNWERVVPILSQHYRCIVPTLPLGGHRLPMNDSADLSPPGIAEIIREFIDEIGLSETNIIGNDTGGAYAQVFAATHPERVSRLVLSNCDALDVFPPAQFSSLQKAINLPGYPALMALAFRIRPFLTSRWALGLLSNRLTSQEIREHYVSGFIEKQGVRRDFRKVANGWSPQHTNAAAERLATVDVPTLLLWGADDTVLFPASLAQRLHDRLPGSSLVFVEGARTYVQVDRPEQFSEHVMDFIPAGP